MVYIKYYTKQDMQWVLRKLENQTQ